MNAERAAMSPENSEKDRETAARCQEPANDALVTCPTLDMRKTAGLRLRVFARKETAVRPGRRATTHRTDS